MKIKALLLMLFLLAISLLFVSRDVRADDQISVINPTSSYILYSRDDGTSWLNDADGDRMILDGFQPRLSPDGRYIVVRRGPTLQGDLYRYDLDTKTEKMIFDSTDYVVGFSWAADGSQIYFDFGCEIYTIDPDTLVKTLILASWPPDDPESHGCYNDAPDVNSVDGRIAWHNQWHGLGLADRDGQNPQWINNTAPDDWSPRWSPDGVWIVFTRAGNLYKIQPDGTNLTQLTYLKAPDSITSGSGAWEKGGSWIFATASVNGIYRLYTIATDGSGKMAPVFTTPGANPTYVGDAGSWVFTFLYHYLPLVMR